MDNPLLVTYKSFFSTLCLTKKKEKDNEKKGYERKFERKINHKQIRLFSQVHFIVVNLKKVLKNFFNLLLLTIVHSHIFQLELKILQPMCLQKFKDSKMVVQIFSSYYRQNWSLPDSIIYCITKNPSNAEAYEKLIQTCKYFFAKNPVLVFTDLRYNSGGWSYKTWQKKIDFTKFSSKIWFTNTFASNLLIAKEKKAFSLIFPKIYKWDIKNLFLDHQTISYTELLFMSPNVVYLAMNNVSVKFKDETIVPFETIVKMFPKLLRIWYIFPTSTQNITEKTVKELMEIPQFSNLTYFSLYNITQMFDIELFFEYIKKNKYTIFYLYFDDFISEAYKARLERIVNEINGAKNHDYKLPWINFSGFDFRKWKKFRDIYDSYKNMTK